MRQGTTHSKSQKETTNRRGKRRRREEEGTRRGQPNAAAVGPGHNEATLTFDWRPRKLYVKRFNGLRRSKRWVGHEGGGRGGVGATAHPRQLRETAAV